jgi:hypothetical protein
MSVVRAPGALWRRSGPCVVVQLPAGEPLLLEGLTGAVWAALDRPREVEELVDELRCQEAVSWTDRSSDDVRHLVVELCSVGLLVVAP